MGLCGTIRNRHTTRFEYKELAVSDTGWCAIVFIAYLLIDAWVETRNRRYCDCGDDEIDENDAVYKDESP